MRDLRLMDPALAAWESFAQILVSAGFIRVDWGASRLGVKGCSTHGAGRCAAVWHMAPHRQAAALTPDCVCACDVGTQVRDNALVVSSEYVRIIITADKVRR